MGLDTFNAPSPIALGANSDYFIVARLISGPGFASWFTGSAVTDPGSIPTATIGGSLFNPGGFNTFRPDLVPPFMLSVNGQVQGSAVPEPSSVMPMGLGGIAALGYARTRGRAKVAA